MKKNDTPELNAIQIRPKTGKLEPRNNGSRPAALLAPAGGKTSPTVWHGGPWDRLSASTSPISGTEYRMFFRGTNFITPHIIRYGALTLAGGSTVYYELSFGPGLGDGPIWGVTVHDHRGKPMANDLSRCFFSLETAETYIRDLNTL